uniref:Uncharacterized protein n=1 Tax=Panagrolaimus davidi TaxID=227884 RepID=A0A914QQC3_9BILA
MLLTSSLRKFIKLSFTSKTKIVFNETTELSVIVSTEDNFNYTLHVEEIKGNITELEITPLNGVQCLPCNANGTFKTNAEQLQHPFQFLIECEVEYKSITPSTWSTDFLTYSNYLKFLNLFECYEGEINFANYEFYRLHWFIKKVETNYVEFTIKNPHQIQINVPKENPILVETPVQEPIVKDTVTSEDEQCDANQPATKDDSVLDDSVSDDLHVPVSVKTIVENIVTFEDEQCYAGKNETINDSVLDESFSNDQHVPIIVSPKVPEKPLNETTSEADKPPTKSQNMAEATFFKTEY